MRSMMFLAKARGAGEGAAFTSVFSSQSHSAVQASVLTNRGAWSRLRDVRLSRGPWRDCPLGAGPLCLRRALSRAVVPSFGAPVSEKKGRLPGSHTREFILGEARFSGVCIQHPSGLLPALWRQRHSRPLPIPLDQKRPHMPSSQPCLPAGKPFLIAHLTRLPLLVLKIHLFIKIHVLGTYHMLGCRTGDIVVNKKRRSPFLNSSPFSQKLLLLLLLLFCLFVF